MRIPESQQKRENSCDDPSHGSSCMLKIKMIGWIKFVKRRVSEQVRIWPHITLLKNMFHSNGSCCPIDLSLAWRITTRDLQNEWFRSSSETMVSLILESRSSHVFLMWRDVNETDYCPVWWSDLIICKFRCICDHMQKFKLIGYWNPYEQIRFVATVIRHGPYASFQTNLIRPSLNQHLIRSSWFSACTIINTSILTK